MKLPGKRNSRATRRNSVVSPKRLWKNTAAVKRGLSMKSSD
jgi:hypothetical protein